jgi:hypothetical protein
MLGESSGCGWRNGLKLWRVTGNILNKQPRTNDKGDSSAWGLGVGLTTLPERHRHISLITLYVNLIAQRVTRKREKEKEKTRLRTRRKGRTRKRNSPPQSRKEICAHDVTV